MCRRPVAVQLCVQFFIFTVHSNSFSVEVNGAVKILLLILLVTVILVNFCNCCNMSSVLLACKMKFAKHWARSIQPKFRPVRPGKVDHLKRWTSFFETFPVGPNRSIEFWTEISGNFGRMDRAHWLMCLPFQNLLMTHHFLFFFNFWKCYDVPKQDLNIF